MQTQIIRRSVGRESKRDRNAEYVDLAAMGVVGETAYEQMIDMIADRGCRNLTSRLDSLDEYDNLREQSDNHIDWQ